jgi:hypothetical protein
VRRGRGVRDDGTSDVAYQLLDVVVWARRADGGAGDGGVAAGHASAERTVKREFRIGAFRITVWTLTKADARQKRPTGGLGVIVERA